MSFAVVVVCTGNICRSPVAERLIRAGLAPGADVTVVSAGTSGLTDMAIDEPSAIALRELGVDPSGHRARRLDSRMLGHVDLVLTATVEHRRAVLEAAPRLLQQAFTLREFARLVSRLPSDSSSSPPSADELRARTAAAAGQRGLADPGESVGLDLGDPFGGGLKSARATAADVATIVHAILAGLGLAHGVALLAEHPLPDAPASRAQRHGRQDGARGRRADPARHRA